MRVKVLQFPLLFHSLISHDREITSKIWKHWKPMTSGSYHHYTKHPWTAQMQTRKKSSSHKQEAARILLTQMNVFTTKPRFVKVFDHWKKLLVNKVGLEALSDYLTMPEECSISVISIALLPSICRCLMTTTRVKPCQRQSRGVPCASQAHVGIGD